MFALTVRDHIMIAHSFKGEIFGPAQAIHGATYVIDVTFKRPQLDADELIVDIGLASEVVKAVLAPYNFQNLDEMPEFAGINTTTERMALTLHQKLCAAIQAGALGESGRGLTELEVKLGESHLAWASYSAPITAA